ncbi:hypothetical protein VTI74DRAFT_523 [Chaetomium olivicolor]
MPVYVVTGARTGIGREYIRQISLSPSNTVFALVRSLSGDISALQAIQATNPGKVHILACDVSSPASISTLPEAITSASGNPSLKVDVVINNAAILHSRPQTALTMTSETLLSHIQTNVLGPTLVFQALLPLLSSTAKVANITSGIGSLAMVSDGRINAEITPYSISKAALNMFTVHQARQLKEKEETKGIVVVAVDPGHVKTEMGGPAAVVEVEDSARGVLKTMEGLGEGDSGRFLLYTGVGLEW